MRLKCTFHNTCFFTFSEIEPGERFGFPFIHRSPHPQICERRLSKNEGVGLRQFYTTDSTEDFDNHASIFFGTAVKSEHVEL